MLSNNGLGFWSRTCIRFDLLLMSTHLVIPDIHAHYKHNNDRADYLSQLIRDLRPDVVVNMGDACDFPSLSSYDSGKKSFVGRTYRADVDSHLEFEDRLWTPIRRSKKKLPRRVFLEGNHEYRLTRAVELQPVLENTISFNDLDLDRNYDTIVRYKGLVPGSINIEGVTYAHFLVAGISGRPLGGEHHAYSLLAKRFGSSTVSHSHLLDYCIRTTGDQSKIHGLVSGCFVDYPVEWAGEMQDLWWSGVVICRNVERGNYDPEFVSLERLRRIYS